MISLIQTLVDLPLFVSVMLKITIILGIGWIAHFSLARYNPRWRVLLWRCIIVGIFLVPALMPLKYLQIRITPSPEPPVTTRSYPSSQPSSSQPDVTFSSGEVPVELTYVLEPMEYDNSYVPQASFSLLAWLRESMWTIVFYVWGIVAAILTSRLFVGFIRIRKRIDSSLPAPERLQRLLDQVADDLKCPRKAILHYLSNLFTPFLAGYRKPVVVLPERMISDEYAVESPAILAHEVAHLCSGDLFWMFATRFVGVLLWFHPLVWKMRDAHNAACEEVCDAVAADYIGNTDLYSSTLARVALDIMGNVLAVGGIPMVRSSDILARLRLLKRKVYSSPLAKRWVTLSVLTGMAIFVCLGGIRLAYAEQNPSKESLPGYVFEGKLIFHQDLPVGLVAGTAEHPKLVEIKSISFENTYGNAWGVFIHVGWLPVIDFTWKIKPELLDEQGRLLRHSRDEEIFFTCKASKSDQATMKYIELELDPMHDQRRRHAAQFRVRLELVKKPFDVTESADTKTHTFEVVVVEQANNNPIADAALVVNSAYILNSGYRRHKILYTTDSQGHCEISLATNELYALSIDVQKQGFASMTQSWSNTRSSSVGRIPLMNLPQQHTFEMLPASDVGGIVQDKDGNAVEAAAVDLIASLRQPRISIRRSVRTDANGQWRVEHVPSKVDRISIGIKHPDYAGDHGTDRDIKGEELINIRDLKHVEILDKGITFTGKVLDDQEQPVSRATIMLIKRNTIVLYTITNSSGEFRFACSGDRNAYDEIPKVVVEAPGYAPALKTIDIEPDPEPLDFRLTRGKTIRCRVVDSKGKPVAGAWTVVHPLLQDYRRYGLWLEDTDLQGEFEIPNVIDKDIGLTVGKQGYIAIRDYVLVPSKEEFTIQMKRALTVQGTVTDAQTGEPIPNFEIATVYSAGRRTRTSNPIVFTEETYELIFDEASQEILQLLISAVGYEPVTSEEFKIDEGRIVFNFQLARVSDFDEKTAGQARKEVSPPSVRRITGIVRDDKGVPISGAVVSTYPSLGAEVVTNAEGTFTIITRRTSGSMGMSSISWPREETTYLLARQKERNLATALEIDEDANNLEIKLSPGLIFSGKVVDVNDKGIPNAEITLYLRISSSAHGTREPTEIDSDGNFEIRAIPNDCSYLIYASADGYGKRYVEAHTSEAVSDRMELESLILEVANLTASGIVVDQFEQPISNMRILASGNGQPNRGTYTDTKGKFTLENMCRGPIRIQANSRGPGSLHGRASAEGGATDIKIVVSERNSSGRLVPIQPPLLAGKSLPDFENIEIDLSSEQSKDKRILICFWDMEQRPSRNCILELSKKADELNAKDIIIIAIQALKVEQEKLNEWVKENGISYTAGMIQDNEEKTRFNWGVKSLPWLILTDKQHTVCTEGFNINELNDKIKTLREK